MITLSHPMGNNFVRAILQGLSQANMLESFQTCLAVGEKTPWLAMLPGDLRQEALRRTYPVEPNKIHQYPVRELLRLIAGKLGLASLAKHEKSCASIDNVFADLDSKVAGYLERRYQKPAKGCKNSSVLRGLSSAAGESAGIYAYEDGALNSFRQAKALGLKCIYDLPIAYWETSRRLLDEEASRLPLWEPTLGGTRDKQEKLMRKTEEANLADIIIVPSRFVYDSLPDDLRSSKRVVIAEFGSPPLRNSSRTNNQNQLGEGSAVRPLRFLFCGSMSQRKGLADVFEAFRILNNKDAQLVVMGSPVVPLSFYYEQFPQFIHEPPRPHSKVLDLMESCNVLILPSIVEGRAQVQQEAMTCGLPLITTKNAGGEDLIDEGQTGFLVPIRSPEIIAEKLNWFLENKNKLPEMSRLAQDKTSRLTWDIYRTKIISAIKEELAN